MAAAPGQCCGAPAPPAALSLLAQLGALGDAPPGGPLRFLETHCGDARAASALLPSQAIASYTACDFSGRMVEAARARLGDRAVVVRGESTALPFEAGSFDRYMSNLGCCCVSDLDAKLAEAHRVLAPGGIAAMSMRIEGGDGDTSFKVIADALRPFGFPPGPDREGLRLGKDLAALKAKVAAFGFSCPVAWQSWAVLPIHDDGAFMDFACGQPPVQKFLASLDETQKKEALEALKARSQEVLESGAFQVAVAAVVAKR
mmetsp:Transcript_106665/g.332592  ORF Transcript_106665/g.332592 Transcript_106665/m.332592 type:complete len:259 (-) Transcript_106665:37-813(-)